MLSDRTPTSKQPKTYRQADRFLFAAFLFVFIPFACPEAGAEILNQF
jgi:hypothetical protein